MSGEPPPLTRCVVCFEDLTLVELAHSPCKHCHVEFCNECLTKAFQIAQKDDVLQVDCPNPHCKKPLNADSMKIQASTIHTWVENELRHRKYGILDPYKNWDSTDIVRFITHQRKRELDHVRRASSLWEDQLTKLRLRAKADLNDVPLAPTLLTNASTDRIDLRSKFTQKMQRSQSVPNVNAYVPKKIQMFNPGSDDDDDDLHTDTDFSDFEEEVPIRPATAGNPQRKRMINAIIDEDQELNDLQYRSPMTPERFFPDSYPTPPCIIPYINGMSMSKRHSEMTMISISTTDSSASIEVQPVKSPANKRKLSATFKAIFSGSKAVSVDVERKRKKRGLGAPPSRPRGLSTSVLKQKKTIVAQGRNRSGSNRILDIFTKHRNKRKKSVKKADKKSARVRGSPRRKKIQKTVSSRQLPSNTKHIKSRTMNLQKIRSLTPDPSPQNGFPRPRSKSQLVPISPALLKENRLSLSYQKQLMVLNRKNKKKNNISHLSPDMAKLKPRELPSLVTLKSRSVLMDPPAMNKLTVNTLADIIIQGPVKDTQLKPPTGQHTPSMSRSRTASATTSISDMDPDLEPPKVLPQLQASYSKTASRIGLMLAPINSTKETDEQLSIIVTPKRNEEHLPMIMTPPFIDRSSSESHTPIDDIDNLDEMDNFDINAHLETEMDADDEMDRNDLDDVGHKRSLSSVKIYSSTEDEDMMDDVPHTFIATAETQTTNTNTNTNTMPIPTSPDILPQNDDIGLPPLNMGLLEDRDRIHTDTPKHKDDPDTPHTPPTPDSPSDSIHSNQSHYERFMRNMDANIAKQTETEPMQLPQAHNNPNYNDNTKHQSPAPPESSGGCNGCLQCTVL